MIAGLFCIQFMMAQQISGTLPVEGAAIDSTDDSFILTPDTLWFITGDDFVEGKPFQIINNHNYPIDIQHIDQSGVQCATCIPWYTVPGYPVYPVTIQPNSSITTLVKFYAIDNPAVSLVYDSLYVNTAGHSRHVIIAADSMIVQIGIAEPENARIMAAPNPFTEDVRITVHGTAMAHMTVTVYDDLMRPVSVFYLNEFPSGNQSLIWDGTDQNGRHLEKGVYFITLHTASGQKTLKVVKV